MTSQQNLETVVKSRNSVTSQQKLETVVRVCDKAMFSGVTMTKTHSYHGDQCSPTTSMIRINKA